MLPIVSAPATAVVASTAVASSKSTIVAILALLVIASALVSQSTEAAILAISTKMAGIAAEALLVGLLWMTALSTLARSVLSSGSRAAGLSTQSRGRWPTALRVAKRLQGVFSRAGLTALLLSV